MKLRLLILLFISWVIACVSWGYLAGILEVEQQQIINLKMDRILRYCKESPICNQLDKDFEKFSSGINVGRFE